MPEGPEILRAAERVARAIAGRVAEEVRFGLPRLARHGAALSGRRIDAVEARGKALLLHFAGGTSVYTHNQLYGVWRVVKPGRAPATSRELRLAIHTREAWALLYSASDIEVLARERLAEHPYLAKLGVELLAPGTTLAQVRAQLDHARFQRRTLAALLLDQGFLAGLGNYLRSEALYVARLAPDAKLGALAPAQKDALARASLELTRQSYRTKGITNDLDRAARLKREGLSFGRYRHHVFDREGEPCWACGTTITRSLGAGRNVFACAGCQPLGSGAAAASPAGAKPRRRARAAYDAPPERTVRPRRSAASGSRGRSR
ncbi:MAG: endonuclease VIII [Pseudomonadota bacterium]